MSTTICDFASLLFWAVIAICVLVCCLEIRKEIRERRAADALARLYHAETFIGLGVVKGPQEVAPKRLLSTVARS